MKQKNLILVVVAVGCGIVAFILTRQMSAGGKVETVDVLVAAKDLPVGTTITREELDKGGMVKIKKMPKDGLPPAYVIDKEQLVDKRLSRPLRAEETFNPADLTKGGIVTLPPGHNMMSLPIGAGQASAGFVGPGSRVDVLATLRLSKQLYSFTLLKNMLIVAVNTQTVISQDNGGAFPNLSMVSFAVQGRESFLLSLAKTRGCSIELILRHPETSDVNEKNTDKDIEENIKLLSEDGVKSDIPNYKGSEGGKGTNNGEPQAAPVTPKNDVPQAAPKVTAVEVLVATHDIAPNTQFTKDLIENSFEWREVPADYAEKSGALVRSNYEKVLNQAIKNGVSKNQWLTWDMLGQQKPKDSPREFFYGPKDGQEQATDRPKRNFLDVPIHTNNRTIVNRYEEIPLGSGKWKKIAELTPEQAAIDPDVPQKGAPDAKRVD